MATQTRASADAILKDLYVGPVIEQLNYKNWMLDKILRETPQTAFNGRRWVAPIHTGRNRGRTAMADAGTLPTAGKQSWQDAIDDVALHAIGVEISDAAFLSADGSNEGAFLNLLDAEVKGAGMDLKKDINREVFGDGTGLLASVTDTANATTHTLDSSQYVFPDDPVDVLVRSTGADTGSGLAKTVVSVDRTTHIATLSSASDHSNTDGLYISGSYGNEMDGLRKFAATGRTLHGINSATAGNEFWNANVIAQNGAVSESALEQLIDQVGAGGNGEIDVILTTRGIRRRLADQYQSQKRFNDARATDVHGGYSAIYVNDVPVIADDDVPKGWVFGLNMDAFKWYELAPPGWMESPKDGSVWHLKAGSTAGTKLAVWQAWYRWYSSLACLAPNRIGALTGVTDDTTGVGT